MLYTKMCLIKAWFVFNLLKTQCVQCEVCFSYWKFCATSLQILTSHSLFSLYGTSYGPILLYFIQNRINNSINKSFYIFLFYTTSSFCIASWVIFLNVPLNVLITSLILNLSLLGTYKIHQYQFNFYGI